MRSPVKMIIKYIFSALFLLCCVSGIDNTGTHNDFTSHLSHYSIVNPQLVHRRTRDINRAAQSTEKHEEDTPSYSLYIKNRKHVLHLKKNRGFLHPDLLKQFSDSTPDKSTYPRYVDCYYHGEVEGYENSMVAVSTCTGLRGLIFLGNESYVIEPVPQSDTNKHLLYQLKDVKTGPVTCGVVSEASSTQTHESFERGQSLTSHLRRKRNLPQTSYIELALVVDNLRYTNRSKNETAVRMDAVEIANLLDGYYTQLNIRVVLVSLDIFKDANPFSVDGTAGEVLTSFVKWRKDVLVPKVRNDIGHLIVGRSSAYSGGILGVAFVGTVCSASTSGGISVMNTKSLPYYSTVVAHEMGHNLGMNHDDTRCKCNGSTCIMYSSATGSQLFSTCSADDFESLVFRGGGACLKNQPPPSSVIGVSECGNGLVEQGEQCDCGKPQDCKNKCCDAATCTLTHGSACAQGACCDNCQIRVSGTPCRDSANACDLPEYCDGSNSTCPRDFYIMDGLPCQNNAAYCYEGRCQTYDFQCQQLFVQDSARKGADVCFLNINTVGNLFGNCGGGTNPGNYIPCTKDNYMCGKVQCTGVNVNIPPAGAQVSIQILEGSSCANIDFHLGSDMLDPGYVKPGSPCANGKTCLNFQCVNASALLPNLNCDAQATCNGRGICNDKGHCHCENGWAPPYCDRSGRGGSIDSGPAQIDYSLRNGLLIFFLLVVPVLVLLILVLLYFFRRESLELCLKKSRKPRVAQNGNANERSNKNVTSATVPPPVPPPPIRPEGSLATSAAIPGYRYGELDYWNLETSTAPAQPTVPPQGPGVPRPIPARPPNIS